MKWYHYIAAFFAGAFLANAVPHFVNGVSGNPFPTPFADPPGEGLSSPTLNVIWGLANIVVGYLLYRCGKLQGNRWAHLLFFVGAAAMGLMLGEHFSHKMH